MQAGTVVNEKKTKKKLNYWYPGKKQNHYDHRWISCYFRNFKTPTLSFRIGPAGYFDNRLQLHLDLLWISIYMHLPIYSTITDECEYPEFGVYYHSTSLVLCWNMHKHFIRMPWQYDWVRTSKLLKDGSWAVEKKGNRIDWWEAEWKEKLWKEVHHYPYTTKYKEVQDDIDATIGVSEMEWRPRWFKWTSLFRKVCKSIDIDFNNEVGSERGSWKGGVLGCGYEMLPGEAPVDTLMRMNKERSFCR